MLCSACSHDNRPGARFCDACGTPLAAPAAEKAAARKVVTVVFADLIGSTALHERLDAESARRVMDRYYRALEGAVGAEGGTVVKLLGDGVVAAFGVPLVAEDDALRAVRAAVGMQQAFGALAREQSAVLGGVGLRVGVNTGEVVVGADNADVVGDPVNVAARLQQEAPEGEVLIGETTRRLVDERVTLAPFGTLSLKGRTETVRAFRVVSLERPAAARATAFVGRDDELRRLQAVFAAAVAPPAARLAVVLGSPGLGKSRLVAEFCRRLDGGAAVLGARCDAAGGATFAPIAEALRGHLRVDDVGGDAVRAAVDAAVPGGQPESGRIVEGIAALLAGAPATTEETFFVVRRLLAGLASTRPVVLVLDDAQWAEPLLLDLVEHLVQWSTNVPLLVLAAGRPELRDLRSSLASAGGLAADVVTLAGLDAAAATSLAASVIGADALPAAVAGRVLAASEGNPLFVGELVRMLVDDGALRREGDRWIAAVELAALEMPPTIQALLAARVERLRPDERAVLERAAVVGRHFSRAAVAHLLPSPAPADLDAHLEALRRSELIEPDPNSFLGEPGLRFHHGLTRDAAYRRLLKGTRAELHERFADWIAARGGGAAEHDELIGWHLEQAHQHLRELGPLDEHGHALGARAARHLAAAGRRALARDDLPSSASLLGRALEALDRADRGRADLALDRCEALLAAGDVGPAAAAIAELERWVGDDARLRAWLTCFNGQLAVLTEPQALRATIAAVAGAASALAAAADAAGEAKAHWVHAQALVRLGQVGACEAALDRALAAARRGGDRRRANAVLAGAPLAALWGPSPVTRASGRCLDVVRVLRITRGSPAVEAAALRCQAVLEALRGRTEAARRMLASSRAMVEELGITQQLLEAETFAGLIDLLEADHAAAERSLRIAYEGLRDHGLGIDAARVAALLGRALLAQDRAAEVEELSHASEALAGDDLKAAIAWRGVRAEALAKRGEHAAAVELARAAVEIAAATDALLDHADARLALASALRAAGLENDAGAEESRAIDLWEAKGATLLVERARRAGKGAPGSPPTRASGDEGGAHAPRRLRANAATATLARLRATAGARDAGALTALIAADFEVIHDPTGAVFGRDEALERFRHLFPADGLSFSFQPLATLGDSLVLLHDVTSFDGLAAEDLSFGAAASSHFVLFEVNDCGRSTRAEVFPDNRLGDCVARLYRRYADTLPPGRGRDRAAATARSVAAILGPFDLDRYAAGAAADVEFVDHRLVGFPAGRGVGELLRSVGSLLESADDVVTRVDDVLALRPDAFLVRWTTSGVDRVSRGAFEGQFLRLCVFDADGLLARGEQFDVGDAERALARLDELVAAGPEGALPAAATARMHDNGAARAVARMERRWNERDWDALVASFAPGFRLDDRRSLVGLPLSGEAFFANLRMMFDMPASRWHTELRATRGSSLALLHSRLTGGHSDQSRVEFEHLSLVEVDASERYAGLVLFEPEDVDAAFDELEALHARNFAGSGRAALTRAFTRAFAARDWDGLTALLAPDLVARDHRLLGWEPLHGPAAYIRALQSLIDLAPDTELRIDHVTMSPPRFLYVTTWVGTRDGGPFESPSVIICELDDHGRIRRFDQYELDRLDELRADFAGRAAPASQADSPDPLRIPPNAATRANDRLEDAFAARDWDAMAALCAPIVFDDRRPLTRITGGCDMVLANNRLAADSGVSIVRTLLATGGDRLALFHFRASGSVAADYPGAMAGMGAFDVETFELIEVDAAGRIAATTVFDRGDRRAASTEMLERYLRSEDAGSMPPGARQMALALNAHDLAGVRAALADGFFVHDHRRTGLGRLEVAEDYVASLAALFEAAPDQIFEPLYFLTAGAHASLAVVRSFGTLAEGGDFESVFARLVWFNGDLVGGVELFEVEDLEKARALLAAARPDPLSIPENEATRVRRRVAEGFRARDWQALRGLVADGFVFDDRRKQALVRGDVDLWIENLGVVRDWPGLHTESALVSTIGDRITLDRLAYTGDAGGGAFEGEFLRLTEVDAGGRLALSVHFDAGDGGDALATALERFAAGEGLAAAGALSLAAMARAYQRHDWQAVRDVFVAGTIIHDRRTLGFGAVALDAWVDSHRQLSILSPDLAAAAIRLLAWNRRGLVILMRNFGTVPGGGPFENVFVVVLLAAGDRIRHLEIYDPGEAEQALRRFAELSDGAAAEA